MKTKNTGRYAVAFTIHKNGKDVVVEFDCTLYRTYDIRYKYFQEKRCNYED